LISVLCGCGSGTPWSPKLTDEQKEEYIQKAIDYVYEEKQIEGYSDEKWASGYRIQFSAGGVLYANEKDSLEHRDEWRYFIPIETGEIGYGVYLEYGTMDLVNYSSLK